MAAPAANKGANKGGKGKAVAAPTANKGANNGGDGGAVAAPAVNNGGNGGAMAAPAANKGANKGGKGKAVAAPAANKGANSGGNGGAMAGPATNRGANNGGNGEPAAVPAANKGGNGEAFAAPAANKGANKGGKGKAVAAPAANKGANKGGNGGAMAAPAANKGANNDGKGKSVAAPAANKGANNDGKGKSVAASVANKGANNSGNSKAVTALVANKGANNEGNGKAVAAPTANEGANNDGNSEAKVASTANKGVNSGGNGEAKAAPTANKGANNGGNGEAMAAPTGPKIPENAKPLEPRKVFVGNLTKELTDKALWEKMKCYVTVKHARIRRDQFTKRSKGFAFVTVNTAEEAQILLNLTGQDLVLDGKPMKISQAHKKIDNQPERNRNLDLSPVDPRKPNIHVLVDDVLIRVLGYVELRDVVRCERVCRRWQALIHGMFAKTTLDLSSKGLGLDVPVSISLASKLLTLHGPHLKELKVECVDYSTEERIQQDLDDNGVHILVDVPKKDHIMKVIGYSCPNLEVLDISLLQGVNAHILKIMARRCPKLRSFTVKKCKGFDERSFKTLLEWFPNLEAMCIKDCQVMRYAFELLPEKLKELKIANCPNTNNIRDGLHIGRRCPNLEVLQLGNLEIPTDVLFAIGSLCPKLIDLKIFLRYRFEGTLAAFPNFANLKALSICVDDCDLGRVISELPFLEKLAIHGEDTSTTTNFSELKNLKKLRVGGRILKENSSATICLCPNLEEFIVDKPETITQTSLLSIIRGCTEIKFLQCAGMSLGLNFITSLKKIMANRTYKIKIVIKSFNLTTKELLEAQYDVNKIEFEPNESLNEIDYPFSDYCESEDEEESDYDEFLVPPVL